MNILIVEDEKTVAMAIQRTLKKCETFNRVVIAKNAEEALTKADSVAFDLVISDILLGKDSASGLEMYDQLRKKNPDVPVVFLTVLNSLKYMERAFSLGALDYITKPFNTKELQIRIKRWSRMARQLRMREELCYNDLTYSYQTNQFRYKGELVALTRKNKYLFLLFLENPERLLTPDYLREKLWGDFTWTEKTRNLRSNIQSLRVGLPKACAEWLETVRGEGYILKFKPCPKTALVLGLKKIFSPFLFLISYTPWLKFFLWKTNPLSLNFIKRSWCRLATA
jgi:DNA-binding response OmpR family regulator